jgi:hypothetical protein
LELPPYGIIVDGFCENNHRLQFFIFGKYIGTFHYMQGGLYGVSAAAGEADTVPGAVIVLLNAFLLL